METRSLTMWAAAMAGCLSLTLLPAAAATAQTDEPSPTATTLTTPQVQPKVTRLLFAVPQTLDELKVALTGLQPLLLRYTGEIGGGDQPGPGVPADQAIESMRKSVIGEFGVEPLVFLVVVDGEVPAARLAALDPLLAEAKVFDSDAATVDSLPAGTLEEAAQATLDRETLLGRRAAMEAAVEESRKEPAAEQGESQDQATAPASIGKPWSPWYGKMQAYNNPYESPTDMPRHFRHYLRWYSSSDLAAFGDDFGYEHNLSLYNYDLVDVFPRPYCADSAYTQFWAGWSTGFKWNAVKYGWTFPSGSVPYWDWDDTTDSCQKLDFSVGVGYPKKLSAGVQYYFWIAAEKGAKSSSPYGMDAQKLSNDCNDVGMDPGSSCMGLNYDRYGSDTQRLVNKDRGWRVPSCADWVRGGEPTYKSNGTYDCPANR
ncbi:hypothetical protein [Streptomyces jeddahensis]|uniref:Uncharacterized protein n=1 Tax=Streptomyces jeddahensis TaxID=1716141 RepID=A0A177HMX4_9ACTN|nr:hypothetical protein [Streptomyces jeddahensis]OAH12223.1 hypothetical protein STSP_44180 [Streptomyces jeddahensis]